MDVGHPGELAMDDLGNHINLKHGGLVGRYEIHLR